ncbi:hypothetical protein CBR_g9068 [Chara braunii]|uniref:Uncharacterized protein n=1 Tax=Chara braunii TaxID=69332 RepID=A0A388KNY4_CHABU|nr:hypothetical protein CBR_g9068 [Chara braunii]|eukprot:GBG71653.1 hypothetical protein CBR_g9068 [Chara braunii]
MASQVPKAGADQGRGRSPPVNLDIPQSDEDRLKLLTSKCYDDGILPEKFRHGEWIIEEGVRTFVVNPRLDELTTNWLKERTVTIIFQGAARDLPMGVREDLGAGPASGKAVEHVAIVDDLAADAVTAADEAADDDIAANGLAADDVAAGDVANGLVANGLPEDDVAEDDVAADDIAANGLAANGTGRLLAFNDRPVGASRKFGTLPVRKDLRPKRHRGLMENLYPAQWGATG